MAFPNFHLWLLTFTCCLCIQLIQGRVSFFLSSLSFFRISSRVFAFSILTFIFFFSLTPLIFSSYVLTGCSRNYWRFQVFYDFSDSLPRIAWYYFEYHPLRTWRIITCFGCSGRFCFHDCRDSSPKNCITIAVQIFLENITEQICDLWNQLRWERESKTFKIKHFVYYFSLDFLSCNFFSTWRRENYFFYRENFFSLFYVHRYLTTKPLLLSY